jgi:protease I
MSTPLRFPSGTILGMGLVALAVAGSLLAGCHQGERGGAHAGASGPLAGKRVAILVEQGFEQPELLQPRQALDRAGATTVVISPRSGTVRAWNSTDWGTTVPVDVTLGTAKAADYDALLLPGGVINPDKLRIDPAAIAFIRSFVTAGKPIAAICHGPWTLIEAGGVKGRRMTSWPSLKTDLTNAGAQWVDAQVVRDGNLVTSRKPDDIPAFNVEMISAFSQAIAQAR